MTTNNSKIAQSSTRPQNGLTEEEWEELREQLSEADREDIWLFAVQTTQLEDQGGNIEP